MGGEQLTNREVLDQLARFMNFSQARSPEEARRALEREPELLDERFDPVLDQLIPAVFKDQPELVGQLERRLVLLRRARVIGPEAAFAEARRVPPHVQELLELVKALTTTPDLDTAREFVEQHPELLSSECDDIFGNLIVQAREHNDQLMLDLSEYFRDLLRRCHAVGIGPAFAQASADERTGTGRQNPVMLMMRAQKLQEEYDRSRQR